MVTLPTRLKLSHGTGVLQLYLLFIEGIEREKMTTAFESTYSRIINYPARPATATSSSSSYAHTVPVV